MVDDRDLDDGVAVRVRVSVPWASRGWPDGYGPPRSATQRYRAAARRQGAAIVYRGDTGGVVAPFTPSGAMHRFTTSQTGTMPEVTDDSAINNITVQVGVANIAT